MKSVHVQGCVLSFFFLAGCATRTVLIKADEGASVNIVSLEDLSKDEKTLGVSPLEVPAEDITGKAIRISKPGKLSAYWLLVEPSGDALTLNVVLPEAPKTQASGAELPINELMRLTLEAFQQLSRQNYQEAKKIAEEASKLAPTVAVPHVISAVASAKLGDMSSSRASLLKAKALDPADAKIEELITTLGVK